MIGWEIAVHMMLGAALELAAVAFIQHWNRGIRT